MTPELSLHLSDHEEAPQVRVISLSRGQYIAIGDVFAMHGNQKQIHGIISQFQSAHVKSLTQALRVFLDMPGASDEEVQLAASVRLNERAAA